MGKKLLCNALLIATLGSLLISNKNKPEFSYKYKITASSDEVSDMLVMYDVKQDFLKKYNELVLTLNSEYHRDAVIDNLDEFIEKEKGVCKYLNETIVIVIGEGKGGSIEGNLKTNICDEETTNYKIYLFDLLFGE